MKKWEPKPKKVYVVAYDFEWFVEDEKQCPYAFGFYYERDYLCHLKTD
jgi:hypothetical protein